MKRFTMIALALWISIFTYQLAGAQTIPTPAVTIASFNTGGGGHAMGVGGSAFVNGEIVLAVSDPNFPQYGYCLLTFQAGSNKVIRAESEFGGPCAAKLEGAYDYVGWTLAGMRKMR